MGKFLRIIEPFSLLAVLAVLAICAMNRINQSALLTVLVAALACLPFFLRYEMQKPRPRDIMPVVVLTAIAVVGRVIMTPIPNFQPVSALVILTGVYFGRQSGFLAGAFTALISNMMLGQGLWTPWQMYAWGMMGFIAGLLFSKKVNEKKELGGTKYFIYLYGLAASMLYGLIMDSWFIVGFLADFTPAAVLTAYGAGFIMNLSHDFATVIFLTLVLVPWGRKFSRIKIKYGI